MALMTALAVASVAFQAVGAYSAAKSQKQAADYNRQVAENNAQIARDNARDVELRGRQAVYDQRRQVATELGRIRSTAASRGLTVDEAGTTPQDMVDAMNYAGELDVLRLQANIEREKRRAIVEETSFRAQAGAFELERNSISPFRSAFGAALGGVNQNADILLPRNI